MMHRQRYEPAVPNTENMSGSPMAGGLRRLFRRQGDWYSVGPRYGARYGIVVGAVFVVLCGLVMWKVFYLSETESMPDRYNRPNRSVAATGGSGLSKQLNPGLQAQEQITLGRELVRDLVSGRLTGSELEAFESLPEFGDCRKCLEECRQSSSAKDKAALDLGDEDCRRNCLTHCSAMTKWLLNQ